MRRLTCLITVMFAAMTMLAQGTQDFASRFMQMCDEDTAVVCVTVSPKMMEQISRQNGVEISENMVQAIHKLKSARIVTATSNGDMYYDKAEKLLFKNSRRFHRDRSYNSQGVHGTFYTRQAKSGNTVELILLHGDTRGNTMVIVNLTGDIDKEFIDSLAKHFGVKTAAA